MAKYSAPSGTEWESDQVSSSKRATGFLISRTTCTQATPASAESPRWSATSRKMDPNAILRFDGAVKRDPAIDVWLNKQPRELGSIATNWFARMRECGADVRELMHDGC